MVISGLCELSLSPFFRVILHRCLMAKSRAICSYSKSCLILLWPEMQNTKDIALLDSGLHTSGCDANCNLAEYCVEQQEVCFSVM